MTYAARNHAQSRRREPIASLVEGAAAFCRSTLGTRIALDLQCGDAGAADVDPSQIEQAVLNLLLNARDALEDPALVDPRIKVVVEPISPGAPELEGRAGHWIAIRVIDNGGGMDELTIQRMCEPFFTTKPVGKGTGLGLATTQAIVRDHGGFITCQSAPGRGATFTLHIPRGEDPRPPVVLEQTTSGARPNRELDSTPHAREDDDSVRTVT
jgi:signal transduction histidine kinase